MAWESKSVETSQHHALHWGDRSNHILPLCSATVPLCSATNQSTTQRYSMLAAEMTQRCSSRKHRVTNRIKDAKTENISLHDLSLIQILWWAGSWNKTSDYSLICNRGNRSLRGYLPPMISDQWRRCITDCQRHIPQSLNARSTSNVVVGGVSCPIIPLFCKTFEIGQVYFFLQLWLSIYVTVWPFQHGGQWVACVAQLCHFAAKHDAGRRNSSETALFAPTSLSCHFWKAQHMCGNYPTNAPKYSLE